jgi:hypothetical protein
MAVSFEPFKSFKASELVSQRGFEDGLDGLNPDSAIQMSEERTCNSEDTQPCSFKAFFALGRLLHWPMY